MYAAKMKSEGAAMWDAAVSLRDAMVGPVRGVELGVTWWIWPQPPQPNYTTVMAVILHKHGATAQRTCINLR